MRNLYLTNTWFRWIINFVIGATFLPFLLNSFKTFYVKNLYDGYTIEQPVLFNKKEIKPCEELTMFIIRESKIDSSAEFNFLFVQVDGKEKTTKKTWSNFSGSIDKGDTIIPYKNNVPCDLSPGSYIVNGIIKYTEFGYEEEEFFRSEKITVIDGD